MSRNRGAVRQHVIPSAGGQDAALAVDYVRRRRGADRAIYLEDPALLLLNELSPISWADLLKTPAEIRWSILAYFTDPWGQGRNDEPVSVCDCCGSVIFHTEEAA